MLNDIIMYVCVCDLIFDTDQIITFRIIEKC